MKISTVGSLRAASSRKINAKVGLPTFVHIIGFRVPSVVFRIAFVNRWHFLVSVLSVSQVLVIPNIIIIVAFYVCSILLRCILNLSSSWSLEPFLSFLQQLFSENLFSTVRIIIRIDLL